MGAILPHGNRQMLPGHVQGGSARFMKLMGILLIGALLTISLHILDGLALAPANRRARVQINLFSNNVMPGQSSVNMRPSTSANTGDNKPGAAAMFDARANANLGTAIPTDCSTTTASAAQPRPTSMGRPGGGDGDGDSDDLADDEADQDQLFAVYGVRVPNRMGNAGADMDSDTSAESELSEKEQAEDEEPFAPSVLLTHDEKNRIAEHLQDVLFDYQAEYQQYMAQHKYSAAPDDVKGTDAELLYREPLPDPHALQCRPHEAGLVTAPKKSGDRLYCFGAATVTGPRVCDVHHHDYSKLHDADTGYDTYELYGKQFAFKPFYRTSVWTSKAAATTAGSNGTTGTEEKALVTAMSQGSWNRLGHLMELVKVWQGPVAFALLLDSHDQLEELDRIFAESDDLRRHVDLHVVWRVGHTAEDSDAFYPINMLRNMALQPISSGYAFVIDVDNVPNAKMSKYRAWIRTAESAVRNASEHQACPGLHAFVPPAVEMTAPRLARMYRANEKAGAPPLTLSKSKLVEGFYDGTVLPMHMYFGPAYIPTNHFEWASSRAHDRLNYLTRFEPYYIARVPVPLFNESFVNRGGNYAQQVYEMHAAGYEFYRLPKAFVVDIPHERGGGGSTATTSQPQAAGAAEAGSGAGGANSASSSVPELHQHHNPTAGGDSAAAAGKKNKVAITENRTKQAVHNEDFIAGLWISFSDWVSHRYGHSMPSPKVVDPAFRRYRRAQDKVVTAMFRLLATKEADEPERSRRRRRTFP